MRAADQKEPATRHAAAISRTGINREHRRWQTAAGAVEGNPGSERQCSAFDCAAGLHRDGLFSHDSPLEDGERIKNRRRTYLPENVSGLCATSQDDMNPAAHLKIVLDRKSTRLNS